MEYFILFLPLTAAILSGFFSKFIGEKICNYITCLFTTISAILSIIIFYDVIINGYENNLLIAKWINSGSLQVNWSIKIDALISCNVSSCKFNFIIGTYLFHWIHVS